MKSNHMFGLIKRLSTGAEQYYRDNRKKIFVLEEYLQTMIRNLEQENESSNNHKNAKILLKQLKEYIRAAVMTPIFTALEVLIPFITASIIDKGIAVLWSSFFVTVVAKNICFFRELITLYLCCCSRLIRSTISFIAVGTDMIYSIFA